MRVLFYLLPVLPAFIYILYFFISRRKLGRGEILLGIKGGNWVRVFVVSLFLTICLVIGAAINDAEYRGDKYTPARYENGELQPSRIEE